MKLARVLETIDNTSDAASASTPCEQWALVQPLDERLEPVGDAHPVWNPIGARANEIVVLASPDAASSVCNEERSTPAGSAVIVGVVDSMEVLARENTGAENRGIGKRHA
jgi:microcompartment protein CcmK/EutM